MHRVRENNGVQIRFLLGPAGSGKTFQCLSEVRDALRQSPEGPPLIFLAPKQATFQIERQLLGDGSLGGYTRLQISSFERLADFVLDELAPASREWLSEEGRVMVLRALLARRHPELRVFRSTARMPGFAQQISVLLRELQQQQLSPERLIELATDQRAPAALRDKLHDVALLLRAYLEWLRTNNLHDAQERLDAAAEVLRALPRPSGIGGFQLWMDGFAEMTPQELQLLAAFMPFCERATLAFCLDADAAADQNASWLSLWSVVAQTYRRCSQALAAVPGAHIDIRILPRDPSRTRFENPILAAIEKDWAAPPATPPLSEAAVPAATRPLAVPAGVATPLHIVTCANPAAEAVFTAREILRFVREEHGRFRDCGVLLRTLDGYHDTLRRVFTRYGIPFFLDRRESVAHHPLAELTRFALRVVAFGWRSDDWFGALKTGLVHRNDDELDHLENEALARGWNGAQWTQPLPEKDGAPHPFENLRRTIAPPFEKLTRALSGPVNGPQLAEALRSLWNDLDVAATLEAWTGEAKRIAPAAAQVHDTVQTQLEDWLNNVARAFRSDALPLHEWLPILESGLSGLSVGVIPPAIDQVLVGTIDRSRSPDLRVAFVLGMNETIFPAPPPRAPILTEAERKLLGETLACISHRRGVGVHASACPDKLKLELQQAAHSDELSRTPASGEKCRLEGRRESFGISVRQRLAHERYFGYIACTRARQRVVLTCAAADSRGARLNPSSFLAHLDRIVPGVFPPQAGEREFFSEADWRDAEHISEIAAPLICGAHPELASLADIVPLDAVVARATQFKSAMERKPLQPAIVAELYRAPFTTSVSALEDFAACPFKFFLKYGLRVKERTEFEVDHRQKGIFQHEVLSEFHLRATRDGKQWRDWTPTAAAALVREIGRETLNTFEDGLFESDDARRFTGQVLLANLERLVATLVSWMQHYRFNPRAVELAFGMGDSSLPGWRLTLDDGRELILAGRIDRIDVGELADGKALGAVVDYKSSGKKLDALKLFNGLELQLLSYLGFVRQLEPSADLPRLTPAGVFYVGLRGTTGPAKSRTETFDDPEAARRGAFRHEGRFNADWLAHFDASDCREQFSTHYMTKLKGEVFAQLIADVEAHLKRFGSEILNGKISVAPYRRNQRDTACMRCEFDAICRFDPWLDPYRALKPLPKNAPAKGATE